MSADIRHWTLLDITHCGHCPFYVADKCRCKREVPSKRIDRPYESVPEWCPLRKAQVIVRVAGDTRLP